MQYLRGVALRFEDALSGSVPIVSATKGIEIETFKTPSQILVEVLGERPICVLTGPSHAEEVALQKPVALLAVSSDLVLAQRVQSVFGKRPVQLRLKRAVKVIRQLTLKLITKHYVSLSRPSNRSNQSALPSAKQPMNLDFTNS